MVTRELQCTVNRDMEPSVWDTLMRGHYRGDVRILEGV